MTTSITQDNRIVIRSHLTGSVWGGESEMETSVFLSVNEAAALLRILPTMIENAQSQSVNQLEQRKRKLESELQEINHRLAK